jgi:hypothetical protein
MTPSAMRARQTVLFRIMRAVEFFRSKRFYLCLLALVVALGLARALTAKPHAPSTKAAIEYFQQKAAKCEIWHVEVYYHSWGSFMLPLPEWALRESAWTYKSIVKLPVLMPWAREELAKMAEELGTMESEPVKVRVKDFRLACVITINKDEEPFVLSFSRYPLSACVNGKAFKASWKLFLSVSKFLPSGVRSELLAGVREDWACQGYPKILEDGEVGEPNQPVK